MRKSRERVGVAASVAVAWFSVLSGACGGNVSVDGTASGGGGAGGDTGSNSSVTSSTNVTSSTSVTTSTTVTSTSTGSGPLQLGAKCTQDGDCGAGGLCIRVGDTHPLFHGGPAGGYCSRPCTSDSECGSFESTCLLSDGGGEGICLLGCILGEPELQMLNDPLDPEKCHGREDVRCQELQDGSQVCLPTCGSDAECAGRFCDPRMSVCVDNPNTGFPLGDACDPNAFEPDCAGLCIDLGGGSSMCTSFCTMGGQVPNPTECGGSDKGTCVYSVPGTGAGDVAFCAQSCTQQDQCQTPAFFCFNAGIPGNGVCIESLPCMSDADCDFLDSECIQTSLGKFCMSPVYPLGSLAP